MLRRKGAEETFCHDVFRQSCSRDCGYCRRAFLDGHELRTREGDGVCLPSCHLRAQACAGAWKFFRHVGAQNESLRDHMDDNARAYEAVAERVETAPTDTFDMAPRT